MTRVRRWVMIIEAGDRCGEYGLARAKWRQSEGTGRDAWRHTRNGGSPMGSKDGACCGADCWSGSDWPRPASRRQPSRGPRRQYPPSKTGRTARIAAECGSPATAPPAGSCPGSSPGYPGHVNSTSYKYELFNSSSGGGSSPGYQGSWAWCSQCQVLWTTLQTADSYCPAFPSLNGNNDVGPHTAVGSYQYFLWINPVTGNNPQPHWRWCGNCAGLYFQGSSGNEAGRALTRMGLASTSRARLVTTTLSIGTVASEESSCARPGPARR